MDYTERYQLMVTEVCKEHDCLDPKQRDALGKMLNRYETTGDTGYDAVVDFLLEADEIDLATALDLRDLK